MIDEYVKMCNTIFAAVGVRFAADELAQLKPALQGELAAAHAAASRSPIVISYSPAARLPAATAVAPASVPRRPGILVNLATHAWSARR